MKKFITYIALGLAVAFGATSCNQDNTLAEGKGEFSLKVLFDDQTRATAEKLAADCTINIYNSEGLIRTYKGIDAVPEKMWLVTGDYRCDILAGKESAASFTDKSYKGSSTFQIVEGQTQSVQVVANVNNAVTNITLDQSVAENFNAGYTFTIGLDASSQLVYNAAKSGAEDAKTAALAAQAAAEVAEDNAKASETAAAGSASTASIKANEAATSASQASTSASAAAGSASTASTKANEAAASATAAEGSAKDAVAAQTAAETA